MNEKKVVTLLLLTFSMYSNAAGYYRCTDANGNTVFSQASCGDEAELKATKGTDSPHTSAGKGRNVFEQLEAMWSIGGKSNSKSSNKRTGVSNKDDPCDGITSLQLRNARVGGDIMQCHTKDDVTSMYGVPTHQTNWTDGNGFDTKWIYQLSDSSTLLVYFRNDKVTSWSIHQ